jgi:acyl carrier protein
MEQEFIKFFSNTLEISTPISLTTSLISLNEWDSLGALTLLSAIDEKYNIMIASEYLQKMQIIRDIFEFVINNKK